MADDQSERSMRCMEQQLRYALKWTLGSTVSIRVTQRRVRVGGEYDLSLIARSDGQPVWQVSRVIGSICRRLQTEYYQISEFPDSWSAVEMVIVKLTYGALSRAGEAMEEADRGG